MTDKPDSNFVMIGLDSRTAAAVFESGVSYRVQPYRDVYPQSINSPENQARLVYQERNGQDVVREIIYKDMTEASWDSDLPSVAKYLLQGLSGIPL